MQKSTSNTKVQKRKETKGKNKKKALITEKNIAKEKRNRVTRRDRKSVV